MWRALYLGFVAATAAVAIYHNGGDWFRSHDLDTEFRDQFHLPAPLDFASAPKRAGGRDPCAGMGLVQAEMQFSDADFARYESSLSDPTVWRPTPLRHYNTNISDYHFAEDALTWRPIIRRASGAFAYDGRDTRTIQTYSEFNDVSNG